MCKIFCAYAYSYIQCIVYMMCMHADLLSHRHVHRFSTVSEYELMVRDLKDGKLKEVKVKGEKLRVVQLERK